MKRKKITLLLLVALIGTSFLKAAEPEPKPWNLKWDTIASRNLYEECVVDSVFKIPAGTNRVVKFEMTDVASDPNGEYYIVNAETGLPFPAEMKLEDATKPTKLSVKFKHKKLSDKADKMEGYNGTFSVMVTISGTPTQTHTVNYRYYNHPTVNITLLSTGVSMNWANGYDSVYWSIDNGQTWFPRSKQWMSSTEIKNLHNKYSIIIKEPNGCGALTIFKQNAGSGPGLARPIMIENGTDAKTDYPAGEFIYVTSGSDFTFTITPKGNHVPVISTSRNNTLPDKDGIMIRDNKNGSYTVTIIKVQELLNIKITYADNANIKADNNNVWSNNGMLYISSATSGNAKVYNVLGALNRMITFSAGETISLPLPTGIYVVSMNNGKAYKVAVR